MNKFLKSEFSFPFLAFTSSNLAAQALLFIIPVWLYDLTTRKDLVSLVSIVETFSVIIFGIISGVLIDNFSKRKITIISSLLMSVLAIFILLDPKPTITLYFSLIILFIILSRFNSNAQNTFMYLKYRNNDNSLIKYNSYTSFLFSAFLIVNPLVGGFLYSKFGIEGVSYVVIFGSLVTLLIYLTLRESTNIVKKSNTIHTKSNSNKQFFKSLYEGFNYSFKDKSISSNLFIFALLMFSASIFNTVFYIYLKEDMGLDSRIYSYLSIFQGIGSILSSIYIFPFLKKKAYFSDRLTIAFSLFITSLGFLVYTFKFHIYFYYFSNFIVGIFLTLTFIYLNMGFQKVCKPEYYGRVNSFRQTLNNFSGLLGGALGFGVLIYTSTKIVLTISGLFLLIFSLLSFIIYKHNEIEKQSSNIGA
ncbi:MFS transporter [Bacillus cereus group sp. BfR-BA-01518]|uniref:MFS transporter n=1 Tax=Bacillus cereus group sp. BfR-BA-01518 TaxID=2920368 RepID=UPI001F5AD8D5|nr:MFS transporter [Bacillus cereus group sp. BfR-BA-01518]